MSKRMITRAFLGSLAAFGTSIVLVALAFLVSLQRDVFIMNGPDVVGVRSGTGTWMVLTLGVLSVLLMLASALGGFTSWLGTLAATGSRPDKTWFVMVLVVGLLSFGFLATLVYLVAGPPDEPLLVAPNASSTRERRPDLVSS
jgi:hypothetical protein